MLVVRKLPAGAAAMRSACCFESAAVLIGKCAAVKKLFSFSDGCLAGVRAVGGLPLHPKRCSVVIHNVFWICPAFGLAFSNYLAPPENLLDI